MDESIGSTIEDVKHRIELIKIHKDACAILEKQIAHFQSYVPPHVQLDYNKRQEEMARLIEEVVEKTENLSPNGTRKLTKQLEEDMEEGIEISNSTNVFVKTRLKAGRDIIIINNGKS